MRFFCVFFFGYRNWLNAAVYIRCRFDSEIGAHMTTFMEPFCFCFSLSLDTFKMGPFIKHIFSNHSRRFIFHSVRVWQPNKIGEQNFCLIQRGNVVMHRRFINCTEMDIIPLCFTPYGNGSHTKTHKDSNKIFSLFIMWNWSIFPRACPPRSLSYLSLDTVCIT